NGIQTKDIFPSVFENLFGTQFLAGFGMETVSPSGQIPQNVIWAFMIGAILLLAAILWTIITTKEYSPEELASYQDHADNVEFHLNKNVLSTILEDLKTMPATMKQLGLVQFCSWFALFGMWVYTTPALAEHVYGLAPNDTSSPEYQLAGNKVGVLFGIYNLISAVYAFALPYIAKKITRKYTHAISLLAGGIGLISIYFVNNPDFLIYSMIGVGMAWASILAMPYAMLAG